MTKFSKDFQPNRDPELVKRRNITRRDNYGGGWFKDREKISQLMSIAHTGTKKPWASKNIVELMVSGRMYKKRTLNELNMKYVLDTSHLTFISQYKVKLGDYYTIADYYLPHINLLIFCDGCYWHGCKLHSDKNRWFHQENDKRIDEKLRKIEYGVLRVWQHEFDTKISLTYNNVRNMIRSRVGMSLLNVR
jgi:DNA mismatch endonuclease (patch repair protein)